MLSGLPVAAQAATSSVWRDRNDGTCSMSATSATIFAWPGSCTSVVTGRPVSAFTRSSMRSPSSRPGPRYEWRLERFALSNEALKTAGIS